MERLEFKRISSLLVIQRSHELLRAIFRHYSDALSQQGK